MIEWALHSESNFLLAHVNGSDWRTMLSLCRRLGRAAQQADVKAAEAVLQEMAEAGLPPGAAVALHGCASA
jgi:hypothetical protein